MYDKYLVTGGSTPIGRGVVEALLEIGKSVRVLVEPESDTKFYSDMGVEVFEGQIFDKDSMRDFFKVDDPRQSILLHVEEICNFSGEKNLNMRRTNVAGTINVVDQVLKYKTGKMVYLSSAYALRDAGSDNPSIYFDRTKVEGDYAQTKAEASAYVMEKVSLNKLNCCLLLPTFIIGPYQSKDTEMGRIIEKYLEKGVAPIDGGHAFVDIRDVINAIVVLADEGKRGEGYILTGEYKSADEFFTELSEARGVDKVKKANKIVNSVKFAKFVDSYYKLTKKDNPKEAYALFRNSPDVKFSSTIDTVMPGVETFAVKESIIDSFSDGPVAKAKTIASLGEAVKQGADATTEAVETAAEKVEEVAEAQVKEADEAPIEEKVETSVAEIPVIEEVAPVEAEEEVAEPAEEAPVDIPSDPVEMLESIPEMEEVEAASEEVADEIVEEAEEVVVEEAAEEVTETPVEETEVVEEATEEIIEEVAEEEPAAEESEEPVVEEAPAEDEAPKPLWAQAPADDNFDDILNEM